MQTCTKRLNKEIQDIVNAGFEVIRKDEELSFDVKFKGPDNTPYSGYKFLLTIEIPPNFPFGKPEAKLVTKIFHPMFSEKGEFCFHGDSTWKAASKICDLLKDMLKRIEAYEGEENAGALQLLKNDKDDFNKKAAEFCRQYAEKA